MSLIMGLSTTGSGPLRVTEKEKALKSGRTAASTLDTGRVTRPTVRADSSTLMATSTRANGNATKHKVKELTNMLMEPSTLETGRKTDSMDTE